MGAVRKPEDAIDKKGEDVLRDLSPGVRETVRKLMDSYKGKELERRLNKILSVDRARKLVERR
jgi:hypothetical protein